VGKIVSKDKEFLESEKERWRSICSSHSIISVEMWAVIPAFILQAGLAEVYLWYCSMEVGLYTVFEKSSPLW